MNSGGVTLCVAIHNLDPATSIARYYATAVKQGARTVSNLQGCDPLAGSEELASTRCRALFPKDPAIELDVDPVGALGYVKIFTGTDDSHF